MASGDTKLTICSDAMILLGAAEISSFGEGSDGAKVADRLYDDLRDQILTMYPWSWSLKKSQLARLVDAPTNEWTYKYALPADILGNPRAVFASSAAGAAPVKNWEMYGNELYTDFAAVWIDYQTRPQESAFPPYSVRLLRTACAAEFAEAVTDQITKADYFRVLAFGTPAENHRGGLFRVAANIDGQGTPPQVIEDYSLIEVRN